MQKYKGRLLIASFALGVVVATQCDTNAQARWRGRYYSGRVCSSPNCSMCNAIQRTINSQRVAYQPIRVVRPVVAPVVAPVVVTAPVVIEKAAQAPLPKATTVDALAVLDLKPHDVYADIGCGDGQLLINAVKWYRCRAVGVELDPDQAAKARRNVAEAERTGTIPKGKVVVIEGDAVEFEPDRHGVTAATAFLFPETLDYLRPMLDQIGRLSIPFHELTDRTPSTRLNEVWLYKKGR